MFLTTLICEEKSMSKRDEIVAAIRKCAEKLGRAPSQAEFRRASKISWHQVYKHFRGMRAAVRAAGLEPGPRGGPLNENALVLDWARVVRELGRLPHRSEYDRLGKHHSVTLHARVGWSQMAHRFVLIMREFHLENEWRDVEQIVARKYPLLEQLATSNWQLAKPLTMEKSFEPQRTQRATEGPLVFGRKFARMNTNRGMRLGRVVAAALAIEILMAAAGSMRQNLEPQRTLRNTEDTETEAAVHKPGACSIRQAQGEPALYGMPLGLAAMAHAPTNEDGVIFLFGVLAAELGFRVERIQRGFPDCEAKREVSPGKWEWARVEFEFESRNFKEHRHDPKGCDVIVCWRHNWVDCPEELEIIELWRLVG